MEIDKRMQAFVRRADAYWNDPGDYTRGAELGAEARAIVALLPEPVDPDLLEVREIVVGENSKVSRPPARHWLDGVLAGKNDDHLEIVIAFIALKRGRELAAGGK